jgi:hypothetical protein
MDNAGAKHDSRCTFYETRGFPRRDCRQCELYDAISMLERECRMNKEIIESAQKTIRTLEAEVDRLERMGRNGL